MIKVNYMDLSTLDKYVEEGKLRKAETTELAQYNYTERTNNEGLWDNITLYNRGNIYEKSTGKLVARSMPKFQNLSELPIEQQTKYLNSSFKCTEKMDGCLGIIYNYNGLRYNSRGSFEGFVVDAIKEILTKYTRVEDVCQHFTLIVEVIHPSTKIIVDYGDTKELYLITAYQGNHEVSRSELEYISSITGMPVVKERHFTWDSILSWAETAGHDEEGFVLTFGYNKDMESYDRVKIKSLNYLKVAAFRRNLCKHTIWKLWKSDLKQRSKVDHVKEYIQSAPDELYKTACRYVNELKQAMEVEKTSAKLEYEKTINLTPQELSNILKETKNKYAGAIWALRRNYEIERCLIDYIEPEQAFEDIDKILEE